MPFDEDRPGLRAPSAPFTKPSDPEDRPDLGIPSITADEIELNRRLYLRTRNPVFVWDTYLKWCDLNRRGFGRDDGLPDWVREYLETTFEAFFELFDDARSGKESAIPAKLAEALGVKRTGHGVRGTAFSSFDRTRRDVGFAWEIWRTRQANPTLTIEAVVGEVAARAGVTEDQVKRAWDDWRTLLAEVLAGEGDAYKRADE